MSLYTYALSTLRTEVETRYDLPASTTTTKPTTAQLTSMVNNSVRRFTNVLLGLLGDDYLSTVATATTTAGVATVNLPTRCFRLQGLVWAKSSTELVRLHRATVDDLLDGGGSPSYPQAWDAPPKYTLLGQTISFVPVPSGIYTLRLVFAQGFAPLSADGDTVELGPGWEEWVYNDVCEMISAIREEDPTRWIQARSRAEEEIVKGAQSRDDNEPLRVRRMFDAGVRSLHQADMDGEYWIR